MPISIRNGLIFRLVLRTAEIEVMDDDAISVTLNTVLIGIRSELDFSVSDQDLRAFMEILINHTGSLTKTDASVEICLIPEASVISYREIDSIGTFAVRSWSEFGIPCESSVYYYLIHGFLLLCITNRGGRGFFMT